MVVSLCLGPPSRPDGTKLIDSFARSYGRHSPLSWGVRRSETLEAGRQEGDDDEVTAWEQYGR